MIETEQETETEVVNLQDFVVRPRPAKDPPTGRKPHQRPTALPRRILGPLVLLPLVMLLLPKTISVGVIVFGNYNTAVAVQPQPRAQPQRNSESRVGVSERKPKTYSVSVVENLPASDNVISELSARGPRHLSVFNDEHLSTSASVTQRQSASAR
jgi:hypothetical protein